VNSSSWQTDTEFLSELSIVSHLNSGKFECSTTAVGEGSHGPALAAWRCATRKIFQNLAPLCRARRRTLALSSGLLVWRPALVGQVDLGGMRSGDRRLAGRTSESHEPKKAQTWHLQKKKTLSIRAAHRLLLRHWLPGEPQNSLFGPHTPP